MQAYNQRQIQVVYRLARLWHIDTETAMLRYCTSGLAKKFAEKHRKEYNLTK